MGLTIMSILESSTPEDDLFFYILENEISVKSKETIAQLKNSRPFSLEWITVNNSDFVDCYTGSVAVTITTYARFLIPSLLSVDKILYLDCDIYVRRSLSELFQLDITDYYAASVTDFFVNYDYVTENISPEIKQSDYFNAGVMLINNARWREEGIQEKLFEYAVTHSKKLRLADQDCLNYVLRHKVLILNPAWNVLDAFYDPILSLQLKDYPTILKASRDPFIRHFKPWKKNHCWEFREAYIEMMKRSPWSALVPKDDFHIAGWFGLFWLFAKKNPFFWASPRFYLSVKYRGVKRTITRRIS
jgi:lipopolysaccharide biosynthesis glycosyltransferase